MKVMFDSSVIVAALVVSHQSHSACVQRLNQALQHKSFYLLLVNIWTHIFCRIPATFYTARQRIKLTRCSQQPNCSNYSLCATRKH